MRHTCPTALCRVAEMRTAEAEKGLLTPANAAAQQETTRRQTVSQCVIQTEANEATIAKNCIMYRMCIIT
jgi:hypothetical protein